MKPNRKRVVTGAAAASGGRDQQRVHAGRVAKPPASQPRPASAGAAGLRVALPVSYALTETGFDVPILQRRHAANAARTSSAYGHFH